MRVSSIDLRIPVRNPPARLLSSSYAVATVGLRVTGCSTPNLSTPARSLPSRPATPPPATSTGRPQTVELTSGSGSVAGHLPGPLAHAGAFTLRGEVFVAGGRVGPAASDRILRFDPARLRFTAAGRLPAGRSDFGVAVIGGTAYLVGGESPKPVDTVIQVRAQAGGTP